MDWFPLFLYLATLGIVSVLPLLPFRELGPNFFRFHATLALLVVALATALERPLLRGAPESPLGVITHVCLWAFAAVVLLESVVVRAVRTDLPKDALWVSVSVGVPAVIFWAFFVRQDAALFEKALLSMHLLSGAALLGASLVAMILGHWYLVNAALSFQHLIRLTRLLVGAATAKLAVAAVYFAVGFAAFRPVLFEFDGMIAGVRVVAGLLAVVGMALMAHSCAKAKSNQSATGILYVVVAFVLIGELCSMYLTFGKGMAI